MKKCISILLAVMLIFSLSIPAYAADEKPSAAFVTFGLGGDFFTEDFASGDIGQLVFFAKELRLGSLACPRRAKKNEVEHS